MEPGPHGDPLTWRELVAALLLAGVLVALPAVAAPRLPPIVLDAARCVADARAGAASVVELLWRLVPAAARAERTSLAPRGTTESRCALTRLAPPCKRAS